MTVFRGDITGDLRLTKGDDASQVTSIGGAVRASESANIDLSACTSVGAFIGAEAGANLNLSACTSVGGHVFAAAGANLNLRLGGRPEHKDFGR